MVNPALTAITVSNFIVFIVICFEPIKADSETTFPLRAKSHQKIFCRVFCAKTTRKIFFPTGSSVREIVRPGRVDGAARQFELLRIRSTRNATREASEAGPSTLPEKILGSETEKILFTSR
jgi:hypothetical protein